MSGKIFSTAIVCYLLTQVVDCDNIKAAVTSLNKIIEYYSNNAQYLNADGAFGLRLCQGQISESRKLLKDGSELSESLALMEEAIEKAATKIPSDSEYYRAFLPVLVKKMEFGFKYTKLNTTSNSSLVAEDSRNYDENRGDHCFLDVMGTSEERRRKCYFTKSCLDYMIDECSHKAGYAATHSLLYIMLTEYRGCSLGFNLLRFPQTTDWYKTRICQKIHDEVHGYLDSSSLEVWKVDMTLEQCTLCGVLGYTGFTSDEILNEFIAWQDPILGCFTLRRKNTDHAGMAKRKDITSPDGCGAHTSGLAAAYFATYIHHTLYTRLSDSVPAE